MKKSIYAPGKTVTYRLGKHDQDIADYLNQINDAHGNIAEAHRQGLRVIISGGLPPSTETKDRSVDRAGEVEQLRGQVQQMHGQIEELRAILVKPQAASWQAPTQNITNNGETTVNEFTRISSESGDDEDVADAVDNLMKFD